MAEFPVHPELPGVWQVQEGVQDEVQDEVCDLSKTEREILLALIEEPKSSAHLAEALGYKRITGNVRNALARLQNAGLIALTIPERPNSKHQKRQLTAKGRPWLEKS